MKGIYFLIISISKGSTVKIGALGSILFEKGSYVYVGSAMNGLENRINRHLREEKKMHWHIDYLLASENAKIARVFVKETSDKKEECRIAGKIAKIGTPVQDFGCGDCRCTTHLFRIGADFNTLTGFSEFRSL